MSTYANLVEAVFHELLAYEKRGTDNLNRLAAAVDIVDRILFEGGLSMYEEEEGAPPSVEEICRRYEQ